MRFLAQTPAGAVGGIWDQQQDSGKGRSKSRSMRCWITGFLIVSVLLCALRKTHGKLNKASVPSAPEGSVSGYALKQSFFLLVCL